MRRVLPVLHFMLVQKCVRERKVYPHHFPSLFLTHVRVREARTGPGKGDHKGPHPAPAPPPLSRGGILRKAMGP
jgi:hypothetical protein